MLSPTLIRRVTTALLMTALHLTLSATTYTQSNASIQGEVTDQNGAVVSEAEITLRNEAIGIERKAISDSDGRYLIAALPVGDYQSQSGNPVNIVTTNSTVDGVAGTLRPDVTGPVGILGSVDAWFDTSVFTPVAHFGSLGRNVVIGPVFNNTDFSITKNTKLGDAVRLQFRTEFFDIFNHANLGQPDNVVGSPFFDELRPRDSRRVNPVHHDRYSSL